MKFAIKNPTETPKDTLEFSTRIDGDGDFMVSANGKDLFFIDAGSGKINRLYVNASDLPGLTFDGSRMVVA